MEEQLISFETAKLAKEEGFNLLVNNAYLEDGLLYGTISLMEEDDSAFIDVMDDIQLENHNHFEFENRYSAPTQSLLQKWLREKYNIIVLITYQYKFDSTPYSYWIYKENNDLPLNQWINDLNTYEEALEKGLQEALKLIE